MSSFDDDDVKFLRECADREAERGHDDEAAKLWAIADKIAEHLDDEDDDMPWFVRPVDDCEDGTPS